MIILDPFDQWLKTEWPTEWEQLPRGLMRQAFDAGRSYAEETVEPQVPDKPVCRWVSVTERLPESSKTLTFVVTEDSLGPLNYGMRYWPLGTDTKLIGWLTAHSYERIYNVTHWLDGLPAIPTSEATPPKGGAK